MNAITKIFKMKSKQLFKEYGFKTYNSYFYRKINNVFQSVCLHSSVSGQDCVTEFALLPLCISYPLSKSSCGTYTVRQFYNQYSWYQFEKNNEKSMQLCADTMLKDIIQYLVPFFEKSINSQKSYAALCQFEREHFKDGIVMASAEKAFFALDAGYYDKAQCHIEAMIHQNETAYQRNKEVFGNELPEAYTEKVFKGIEYWKELNAKVKSKDIPWIKELLWKNEQNNL